MRRCVIPIIPLCLGLQWMLTTAHGQSCDTTLTATSDNTNQTALIGSSGMCTWTINALNVTPDALRKVIGDATYTVQVYFRRTNFSDHDTCDETNGIVVYDGDTSGVILGLVCADNHPTFQSSRSTLTIRYPASEVTDTSSLLVVYKQLFPTRCPSPFVYAVASSEYSILSPMYPGGIQNFSLECQWYVRSPDDTERARVTIETASTLCSEVNVTIRYGYERSVVNWCPGQEKNFMTWGKIISLKLEIGSGQSVRVKYRALETSPCNMTLNVTTQEQFLTTPGYPSPYPSFTECHWKLRNYNYEDREHNTIRLEVVDMDIEETQGCRSDSLAVRNGWFSSDDVISTTCAGDKTSFYVYKWMSLVIFRSARPSNTRRGIKLKLYAGTAEPCGGNLTATSSSKSIESPGFPFAYPGSAKCVWTISAENADSFVSVEFAVTEIFGAFSRCGNDVVKIHDGSSESGYVLGEVCKTNTPTFQSTEPAVTVVFKTDRSYTDKGFRMNYKETKVPVKVSRHVTTRRAEAILMSPRYPDGEVKDVDITWTFTPQLNPYEIRLMFTEVDLGDTADCSDNYIQVFYGDTSSPLNSTLCGTETGVYMSRDSLLTVVMKTGDSPAKRGFKAKYYMLYSFDIKGCEGEPEVLDAYSSGDTVETPFYPSAYPNLADCVHLVKAFSNKYFIRVKVDDIEFVNPNNCSNDYIELFDGNTTESSSLGRICQNTTKTFDSTGHQMLLRFISDSNLAAKGAKISYQGVWIESDSGTSYLWVVILVSVLGGLVIVAFVVYKICAHKRKGGSAAI